MATVKDTVRELNEPIKVHYHDGDREPRLTPMALAELENLHTRALDLINRLDGTIVDSEQLFKRIYEQKGEAETRVAKLEAEKAQLEAERDALKEALGLMVYQYCVSGTELDHRYMCAGETAFRVLGLEQYGDARTLESWLFPECQDKEK